MDQEKTELAVDLLLTKLGTDDSFRSRFLASPAATLASLGIASAVGLGLGLAGNSLPGTAASGDAAGDLASKESFMAARETLRSKNRAPFTPITLDFTAPTGSEGLASKESFLAARDTLRSKNRAPFHPISLEVTSPTDSTT